jgi:hypothetical protein
VHAAHRPTHKGVPPLAALAMVLFRSAALAILVGWVGVGSVVGARAQQFDPNGPVVCTEAAVAAPAGTTTVEAVAVTGPNAWLVLDDAGKLTQFTGTTAGQTISTDVWTDGAASSLNCAKSRVHARVLRDSTGAKWVAGPNCLARLTGTRKVIRFVINAAPVLDWTVDPISNIAFVIQSGKIHPVDLDSASLDQSGVMPIAVTPVPTSLAAYANRVVAVVDGTNTLRSYSASTTTWTLLSTGQYSSFTGIPSSSVLYDHDGVATWTTRDSARRLILRWAYSSGSAPTAQKIENVPGTSLAFSSGVLRSGGRLYTAHQAHLEAP